MLNFTVGPVQEPEYVLDIGKEPTPYFRNASFSSLMIENEDFVKKLAYAPKDARTVFLTASGTGAMEAAVMNVFTRQDKVLVINGGSFGKRFAQICEVYSIPYEEINIPFKKDLTRDMLEVYSNRGFTGLLVNIHETSIGKLYDVDILSDFCKKNNLLFVVDAISSFLADPINMESAAIDVMITSSQKALAVPPGISLLVLSSKAIDRINNNTPPTLYFDLKAALKDGLRGQTPFTPAVSILIQLNRRLQCLVEGGVEREIQRVENLARYFRERIINFPFTMPKTKLSNAVTPLLMKEGESAYDLFQTLERDFGIWVCPSGGEMKEKLFRVGHIGNLHEKDIDYLLEAMEQYCAK
ncbi:MAG: pyridoxal-phosphate-dependent aminotransferase family protein [Agathobacter sp.]